MHQNTSESAMVSVIIPVYNVQMYLAECVDSVINQTYKNLEIILVDDGSTDNTLKLLRNISNDIVNINIISQNNTGVSGARNNALKKANGKYITYRPTLTRGKFLIITSWILKIWVLIFMVPTRETGIYLFFSSPRNACGGCTNTRTLMDRR